MNTPTKAAARRARRRDPAVRAREAEAKRARRQADPEVRAREARRQADPAVRRRRAEAARARRQDPAVRAREAEANRTRRQANPELQASDARRRADPAVKGRKAEADRKRRQENPEVRARDAAAKRRKRLLPQNGRPTYCNTCKKSTRNAQTATIPPLKGGVDVAVGTKRRADCKLCKSTQASFGPLMVDWWTDTADLENLQDASADRREQPVPFVHGSSGLHERKQSPGVSAVHDSQLDGEGPASGSSDLSLDSAYFVSTGPEGDSGRRAEVAVDRTILPRNVSKPVTIEVSANPLYTCAFCLTAFGHLRDLAGHVEACPWPEPYLCGLCSEPCKDWKTTRAHMSAHVGKRLACPFCQRKIYKLKYDLVHRHIMLHVTVRQFMCSLCRSAFPSKEGLRSHHSMSRSKGLSCRHTKRRPRKGNASCPRPTVSTHR
ncbi:uncharacterized protein LOC119401919 isoform X2 [Rhipicephalus sanguineus]|uniref:uncharacterized protein LOC119401919 isoform X2 n=1 Tax=Rhipicephalus sanguineus TaxID=34632 RepID=UPI00189461BE|nr:uncharacterized protein LOC119401919 isoform X2 [Rhipicephalus sanguineus]